MGTLSETDEPGPIQRQLTFVKEEGSKLRNLILEVRTDTDLLSDRVRGLEVKTLSQSGPSSPFGNVKTLDSRILAVMQTEVYPRLQSVITPMGQFLQLWTDDKHNPGNLLLKKLNRLEDMIRNVETPSPTGSGFSLGGLTKAQGMRESSSRNADRESLERALNEIDTLKVRLSALQRTVDDFDDEAECCISVGTLSFWGKNEFLAWFKTNGGPAGNIVRWFDAVSMLCLADAEFYQSSLQKSMQIQTQAKKLGYTNTDMAYYKNSFGVNLPPQFLDKSLEIEGTNIRKLPAFETHKDYDSSKADMSV